MKDTTGRVFALSAAVCFIAAAAIINLRALTHIRPSTETGMYNGGLSAAIERQYRDLVFFKPFASAFFGVIRYFVLGEGRKGVIIGREGWLFSTEELARPPGYEEYGAKCINDLAQLTRKLEKEGTQVVIALIPEKADIYGDMLPSGSAIAPNLSYEELLKRLTENGITAPDLRTALAEERKRRAVFLKSDTHWTPAGAEAAARAVAAAIPATELQPRKRFVADEGAQVSVRGDLMNYVDLGGLEGVTELGSDLVHPPVSKEVDGNVADLFEDDNIPVNLIGTSYSANETWGFSAYLRKYLGADVMNVAESGMGPFEPMEKYFKTKIREEQTPQVVIWEIPLRYLAVRTPEPVGMASGKACSGGIKPPAGAS